MMIGQFNTCIPKLHQLTSKLLVREKEKMLADGIDERGESLWS